jgi:hypothetical protein
MPAEAPVPLAIGPTAPAGPSLASRVERLEAEVARLASDLAALRRDLG